MKQKFYLRLEVKNSPGTLAVVSKELSRHAINIGSVLQPEADESAETAELVLTCGPTVRSGLERALKDVAALDEVVGEPFFLPIIKTPDPLKAAA